MCGWPGADRSASLRLRRRVRRARGAEMPPSFRTDPLMYQAASDGFLPPVGTIPAVSEEHGIDFEAEVGVVTGELPMAAIPEQAAGGILLIGLVNDVSLRNLIPAELAKGFGFLQSKPRSALSPVLVTPDELGGAWQTGLSLQPRIGLAAGNEVLLQQWRDWIAESLPS